MQVVFLDNVPGAGKRGQAKEVKEGYFLNFLAPRNLALPAGHPRAKKLQTAMTRLGEKRLASDNALEAELLARNGRRLAVAAKASKSGKLFEQVKAERLAVLLGLPEGAIKLRAPIKTVGEHSIDLSLHGRAVASLKVDVTPNN